MSTPNIHGETHLSDLVLDRIRLEELSADDVQQVNAHLSSCARCAERLQTMRADAVAFEQQFSLAQLSADALMRAEKRPKGWLQNIITFLGVPQTRALVAGFAVACVAAIVLVPRLSQQSEVKSEIGFRYKGGLSARVYVKRQGSGQPWQLKKDEVLRPGDQLRFVFDTTKAGFVYLLGADETLRATLYDPEEGKPARYYKPGVRYALPGAIELDAKAARETFYVVRCKEDVPGHHLLTRLQARAHKQSEKSANALLSYPGCEVSSVSFRKSLY